MNSSFKHLILASASPRRRELLSQIGYEFDIIPADCEEIPRGKNVTEKVMSLAKDKAKNVFDKLDEKEHLVIGADTIVVYENRILGKPRDYEQAYEMLRLLSGKEHEVITGVCLLSEKTEKCFYEKTIVKFYDISDEELDIYIRSKDPFDKAGGYGIQGAFAAYVKSIEGDYYNVVGLPVSRIYHELKALI